MTKAVISRACCLGVALLLGWSFAYPQNGPGYRYSCSQQNLSLALKQISETYGLYFSYPLELTEGKTLHGTYEGQSLDLFLDKLFEGQGISHEQVDNQFVVLSKGEDLPKLWRLCGTVLDSSSARPLAYASIYDPQTGKGINADRSGNFVFEIKEGEIDSLRVGYAGYEPLWIRVETLINQACKELRLVYRNQTETGILITEYLSDGVSLTENGAATLLELNRMSPLPGQTDADALRSLRFLPGISSPQGELSQLFVRGGTPDQNLIAWEEIPIYQTAYYFGMISAFNPDFIEQIKVYRGGFGPEFSNRVSGVIDLRSQVQLSDTLSFGTRIDGLLAAVTGHVPLSGERLNLSFSLRRSISDLWPSPTFQQLSLRAQQDLRFEDLSPFSQNPNLIFDPDLIFRDGQLKLTWQASKKDKLSLSALANENRFGIYLADTVRNSTRQDSLRIANQGMSLVWNRSWTKGWSTQLSGLFSGFDQYYRYQFKQMDTLSNRQVSFRNTDLLDMQGKASIQYQSPWGWRLKGGYQIHQYELAYHIEEAVNGNSNIEQMREQDARLHGAYLSFSSREDQALGFEIGGRLNRYSGFDRTFLGPRAGIWYHFGTRLSARLHLGRYHQFLAQLLEFQGQAVGLSIPIWILAQPPEPGFVATPPQVNDQIQVGLLAQPGTWVFDLQFYLKRLSNVNALALGFGLAEPIPPGEAAIRGLDVLIKKRWPHFRTWVSYSLSQVDYRFPTFRDEEFPAPYDQRHQLSVIQTFDKNGWQASMAWQMGSGLPYTQVDAWSPDLNQTSGPGPQQLVPSFQEYLGQRLPIQHQMNASVSYRFSLSGLGGGTGQVCFSVLNLYGRQNVIERSYFPRRQLNAPGVRNVYADRLDLNLTPNLSLQLSW